MTEAKKTGEVSLSGVVTVCNRQVVIVGRLNSECSQQNSANKRKHGAHSQHIQSQGMVHGRASLVEVARHYHESLGASKRVAAWQSVEFS
jgi:hypothetical protein